MTFRILSSRPIKQVNPLFDGYQEIRLADDMRGEFINPKGVHYTTSLWGCTCRGYQVHGHCKHFDLLWQRTPCACGQPARYEIPADAYACDCCGRTQVGEVVRTMRAARLRKTA